MTARRAALALLVGAAACGSPGAGGGGDPVGPVRCGVDAAGPADGDGSESRPFATLRDAAGCLAQVGAVVTVRAGVHEVTAELDVAAAVRLEGEGSARSVLRGAPRLMLAGDVTIRGIAIDGTLDLDGEGGSVTDLRLEPGATLRGDVVGIDLIGVRARDAALMLEVRDAVTLVDTELAGTPVTIRGGAAAQIVDLRSEGAAGIALHLVDVAGSLTRVTITDVTASGGDADLRDGVGILVERGTLVADAITVQRTASRGVVLDAAELTGSDVRVEGNGVAALAVQNGAMVTIDGLVAREAYTALFVSGGAAAVSNADLNDARGSCALVSGGGRLDLVGGLVARCPDGAVSWLDGTRGSITATIIEDTTSAGCVAVANAVEPIVLRDVTVRRCAGMGVSVLQGAIVIEGVAIADVQLDPVFGTAEGLAAVDADVQVDGLVVERVAGAGVSLLRSSGRLAAVDIRDTDDAGIRVQGPLGEGASVAIDAGEVAGAAAAGVFVGEATVGIEGTRITGTRLLAADGLGDALVAGPASVVTVRDATLASSAQNGVLVFGGATVTLERNTVRDNAGWGVAEFCLDGDPPNALVVTDNAFSGNGAGDVQRCE